MCILAQITVGVSKAYTIAWDLVDAQTGALVWSTQSRGHHTTALYNDENPQARATVIVEGIIAEFKKSNLL